MRIAILGATSQIAMDLIKSISEAGNHELYLYARRTVALKPAPSDRARAAIRYMGNYASFGTNIEFDALINFVGVGNPAAAIRMGADIFDITLQFDQLALDYVRRHPRCRYIFLSSGAAYGSDFSKPAERDTSATIPINRFTPQDWYGAAKLHAECRHRAYHDLPIIDIRLFNYFSASQNLDARFLICDIMRSIRERTLLKTSTENIIRDYLHPSDFYRLVEAILSSRPANDVIDGYSRAPIDKLSLLNQMQNYFNLNFELHETKTGINSTGSKPNYYSLNNRASEFNYTPTLSSIEGITREAKIILNSLAT